MKLDEAIHDHVLLCCAMAVATSLHAGCAAPATEVLVIVDTDIPAERRLSMSADAWMMLPADTSISASSSASRIRYPSTDASAIARYPVSFGVVRGTTAATGARIVISAEAGAGPQGEPPLRFREVSRSIMFVSNARQVVRVVLSLSCGLPSDRCRATTSECTIASVCAERGERCLDGRCVGTPIGTTDPDVIEQPLPCVSSAECVPGLICNSGRCGPCTADSQCAAPDRCVLGTCRACTEGASCDDSDACTYGDACRSGLCRGTPLTCTTDACVRRTCNGTSACTEEPLGTPMYVRLNRTTQLQEFSTTGGADWSVLCRRVGSGATLYVLESTLPDRMLSRFANEASSCDWCGCATTCGFRNTRQTFDVSDTQLPGTVALMRGVRQSPFRHVSYVGATPMGVSDASALGGFVCAP